MSAPEGTTDALRATLRWLDPARSAWIALALLFVVVAALAGAYDRFFFDRSITEAFQDIDTPAVGGFLDAVNVFGIAWLYVPLTLALAGAFALLRAGIEAALLLLTFVPRLLTGLLKEIVERPRPSGGLVEVHEAASGFAFPSGHTVGTAALFGVLFFLIPAVVANRALRWSLQAGCLLVVLGAGPARVYEGAHWPSDVLASYLLVLVLAWPVLAAYSQARRGAKRPSRGKA